MSEQIDTFDPATTAALLGSRRTVHDFLPDDPPEDVVMAAIEAARWAPNHHRTEPWRFYLLGSQAIETICHLNAELVRTAKGDKAAAVKLKRWREIPGWMVLTCHRSDDPIREREDYAATCCAAQNFMLYLWANGLGVKWTTGSVTREPAFFECLGIDAAAEQLVGMFWYGKPRVIPDQHRKPLAEITQRIP